VANPSLLRHNHARRGEGGPDWRLKPGSRDFGSGPYTHARRPRRADLRHRNCDRRGDIAGNLHYAAPLWLAGAVALTAALAMLFRRRTLGFLVACAALVRGASAAAVRAARSVDG
jgi:hypothetical protein